MKMHEAIAASKSLPVTFPDTGAVLNVTYKPMSYTVADIERMQEEAKDAKAGDPARIIERMQEILLAWDLETEDGTIVDISDAEQMRQVPTAIFIRITRAVVNDQNIDDAEGKA